jgi:prepilin-type processing-associated H-X9-DG protein
MTYRKSPARRPAWTRADGLVAILALTLAGGLSVTAVAQARAKASRVRSADNLRTIGEGMHAHVSTYGFFPGNGGPPMEAVDTPDARTGFPDSEAFRWGYGDPKRAGRLQTGCWAYAILPFIGEEKAFRTQDHTRAVPIYYLGSRRPVIAQHVPKADPVYAKWTYFDDGLGPWGRTDYAANDQVVLGGMGNVMRPGQVSDGLATTFLAGEKAMDTRAIKAGGWYWDEPIILGGSGGTGRKGDRLLLDSDHMLEDAADNWGSPHAEGVYFLFCDGHVRLLGWKTDRKTVAALISPRGGEEVDLD